MSDDNNNDIHVDSDRGNVTDGYHTFNELYEHRAALYLALCRAFKRRCWRSRLHSDGSAYPGWFVLGIDTEPGMQITYHLPERLWHSAGFADTRDQAPEWDGHTAADVIERIGWLYLERNEK